MKHAHLWTSSIALLLLAGCDGNISQSNPPPSGLCDGLPSHALDDVFARHFAPAAPTGCAMAGCHATGAGGLTFRDAHELWASTVNRPTSGDPSVLLVFPGNPERSRLYQRCQASAASRMPQGGPYLDDAALAELAGWICAGAPEPRAISADAGIDGGLTGGPTLDGLAPSSGVVGTQVTLTGTGFSSTPANDAVEFNGVPAPVTTASATSLTTTVPTGATTGPIRLTVAGQVATSAPDFQVILVNPVPTLTAASPSAGVAGSADLPLTLSGGNFVGLSTATLDGTPLATTYQSATSLSAVVPAALLASAGSHTLTVTNPGPGGGTSAGLAFAVRNPLPTIASLAPASAPVGSPALTLTVTGTGFLSVTTVTLNGTAATPTIQSGTSLTVPLPASLLAAPASVSVVASNPAPGGGSSAPASLPVENPAPTLQSLTPSAVIAGGGNVALSLTGSGFIASSQVRVDGASVTTSYVSATGLTASLDATLSAVGGTHAVTVTNPMPGGGTSASRTLTVNNPTPALTTISPANVATNGAAFTLSISGAGFNAASVVSFAGAPLATTLVGPTLVTAQIPTLTTAASYPVVVNNPAPGGGASNTLSLVAATSSSPSLTGLSPTSGPANSAFTLTVSGGGDVCGANQSVVLFNSVPLAASTCTSTQLTVSVPSTAAGAYPVQVRNPGTGLTSGVVSYNLVSPNPVPTLSALSPASGAVGASGFTLTLLGIGFVSGSTVTFNGAARTTTFVSATQLTAAIPSSDLATAGNYPVAVTSPSPGGGTSNALSFPVVTSNPVPTISALSPSSVSAGTGAVLVSITGTGFVTNSAAAFNGSARTTTFGSATSLTISLTATDTQSAGSSSLTVANPTPGGGLSNAFGFSVVAPNPVPVLTTLSPMSANVGGAGFTLTVTGTGFVSASQVSFSSLAKTTTFVSSTQLTAAISAADISAAGTVPVTVSSPAPGGGTSSPLTFQVVNPTPTISSLTPSTVAAGSSAFSLSVAGTNFVSRSVVQVDGSARTTSFVNSTQLSAAILASDVSTVTTHTLTVVTPTPGGGASNGATLTVANTNPVPVISSLSPCGKVAGTGAFTLTINGTGFVNGATATFTGSAVTVTFVSATQLTAAIPAAAITTAPTGDAAAVIVTNPAPGGGPSSAFQFGVAKAVSTLAGNVQPIFSASCATAACHVTGSATAPMSLQSGAAYADTVGVLSSAATCQPEVRVQGCGPLRSQSVLVDKILATTTSPACSGTAMPKGAPLSAAQIQTIVDWIAQGAPP